MASGHPVKSAKRVLEVLEYFAEHHHPATVTEVSTQLGFPQSSTSALLSSLVELGYLMFDRAQRTYRPTLRVMLLGAWMHDELFGEGSLVSELDKLRRSTRCTVMIGVRQQLHTRVMLVLWGPKRWAPRYTAGSLIPIPRSSLGKILLCHSSQEEALRIIKKANSEFSDPAFQVAPTAFLKDLAQTRAQGWADTIDYPRPGLGAVAVALPALPHHPQMALALGTTKTEVINRKEEFVSTLQNAVARLKGKPALVRGVDLHNQA